MALILENGALVADAQSFGTLAEFKTFAEGFFGSPLTGSDALLEASLWRSFVYMSGLDWKSSLWPTFGGSIPTCIQRAQFCFARAEALSAGILTPQTNLSSQKVLTKAGDLGWTPTTGPAEVEKSRTIVTAGFDFLKGYLINDPSRDSKSGLYLKAIGS